MKNEHKLAGSIVLGACAVGLAILSTTNCDAACQAARGDVTSASPVSSQTSVTIPPIDFVTGLGTDSDALLIDLRTPEEYVQGRLFGATLIDFYSEDFDAQLAALDRNATYYIYCNSGNRSGQTLQKMRELGFTTVYDLGGGIQAWQAENLPVVTEG
jgi:rhodanese-related sulfurtransferase